jgi:hypothetical protein
MDLIPSFDIFLNKKKTQISILGIFFVFNIMKRWQLIVDVVKKTESKILIRLN